jgi:hypothetical protein
MSIQRLDPQEIALVKAAFRAAVDGEFFPDWEFATLFGISRLDMRAVAQEWPMNRADPTTEVAVFNALTNLVGYPHNMENELAEFGLSVDAMRTVLFKLQRDGSDDE